jgi:hypothetical protein
VSDEDEKKIEETFIDQCGAKYPFVKANGVNEQYGIKFFPSVFCIDANGVVYSVPDDRMPSEQDIEELLKSVSLVPKMPDESRYDPIRAMGKTQDHAKLRDSLDKMLAQPNLDEAMREVFDAQLAVLQKRADAQVARVERLGGGPDYVDSAEQLEQIVKAWKGFPASDAAKEQLARFSGDSAIKKETSASKALRKILSSFDPSRESQAKKLVAELEKFMKKYEGTYAAGQAEKKKKQLQEH